MTHTPPESKAWPNAGAADRPSASGEQVQRQGQSQEQSQTQPASDLPAAADNETTDSTTPPFPEAGRHEGDTPERDGGKAGGGGSDSERL